MAKEAVVRRNKKGIEIKEYPKIVKDGKKKLKFLSKEDEDKYNASQSEAVTEKKPKGWKE